MTDGAEFDNPPISPQNRLEEFVALLGRSKARVHAHILSLLTNWADTDDVLQRTNIILWRKFSEWRPEQDFTLWACGIARLEVKNFLRGRSRDRLHFNDELIDSLGRALPADVPEQVAFGSKMEALQSCLMKLRPRDRELIDRYYQAGSRSGQQIASELGRPYNTLRKALIRIRRTLHECIERTLIAKGRS